MRECHYMCYSTKIMIVIMYRIHHYVEINIEIMMTIKGNWLNRQILPYSQIKDQLIINNFNDKYIIFIDSQSNKKSYFCSFTTNMALNPFGIYCKFAINSESKAVFSFSVKCQSNKNRHQLSLLGIVQGYPRSLCVLFNQDNDSNNV